ncbi:MAG: SoxR reducing system RseC family protein [Candidatus Cloacimonetes bacterium]|nr:SoxR reducing system RseC family protein [Candidatus Cloacimonadota bacterium]
MEQNNPEDLAVVIEVQNNFIIAEMKKSESCKSCSMSGMCMGTKKSVTHKIQTKNRYEIGDVIEVSISAGYRIFSSFLIFVFPIIMMIIFYLISRSVFHFSENISILMSFSGLLFSGVMIYFVDKKLGKKLNVNIVGKVG